MNVPLVVSLVFLLVGLIGAITHGVLGAIANSTTVLKNQYLSVWFSALVVAQSVQLFYTIRNIDVTVGSKLNLVFKYVYFTLSTTTSLIIFVCYCIIGDCGSIVWSFILIGLNVYSIVVIHSLAKANDRSTKARNLCQRILGGFNVAFQIIVIFIMCLLSAGGIVTAMAYQFPMPGIIVTAPLIDGRSSGFHVYCKGPKNASLPVIWIVADAAHGVVDFYGIQEMLNNQNRRVCTYDNAGFGWSYDIMSNEADQNLYFDGILTASGEGLPVILVGNGGGGSFILKYQNLYPSKVAAIVFVEVFPSGIEFDFYQNQSSPVISDAEKFSYRSVQMQGRMALTKIILGLAIPWGLMPLFDSIATVPSGYYPPSKAAEYKMQSWKSNLWLNQLVGLQYIDANPDSLDPTNNLTLAPNVPFYHILCKLNDTQVCAPSQTGFPSTLTGSQCANLITQNNYYFNRQVQMTNRIQPVSTVGNVTLIYNSHDSCRIDLPLSLPSITANQVFGTISWISI